MVFRGGRSELVTLRTYFRMIRIHPVTKDTACEKQQEILSSVEKAMGGVPNLISTMAQSPAVANAYLGFSQALAKGALPAKLRESIALVVGEENACQYCLSAHTVLGGRVGLSESDVVRARGAEAEDPKTAAALRFAKKVVAERGIVEDGDVEALRESGFEDGGIAEIVANVALNLFTNYFNHVAGTEIDFPRAPALQRA